MATEIGVGADAEERLRNLNAEIVAAVAQRDHERLPDVLAQHRALVTELAPRLTAFARAEVGASIRRAIFIAASERERVQQLLNDYRFRAAMIAAYLPPSVASPGDEVHA